MSGVHLTELAIPVFLFSLYLSIENFKYGNECKFLAPFIDKVCLVLPYKD